MNWMSFIVTGIHSFPGVLGSLGVKDIIDIVIVSALIYFVFIFVKQTRSFLVFNSFLFLLIVIYLSKSFDLTLTRQLFQPLLTFFLVIFVVVFQREIRHFFDWFSLGGKHLLIFSHITLSGEVSNAIVESVEIMARERIGAIIVIAGEFPIDDLVEGGSTLDGKVSTNLLLSIFDTGSPGHDGAVLIEHNAIKKFGLHLPLAENYKYHGEFGTRHRAAIGITEKSDALAIVVSEEKGIISLAENGSLSKVSDAEDLRYKIKDFLKENITQSNHSIWQYIFIKNFFAKVSAVVVAFFLWFFFVYQIGVGTRVFTVPLEVRYVPKQYVVERIAPQEVSVSVSGKNSDLLSLEDRQFKVLVDGSQLSVGVNTVVLTNTNVDSPAYVTVVSTTPEKIVVQIEDASVR